jgi:hypothetical protein
MVVKYIYIFYLKNGAGANNEFWCIFINVWIFSAMLIVNGVNWSLPGLYGHTYEMCTCSSQDYNLPSKFDNTNSVLVLITITVYVFVSIRIKIYKNKVKPQENYTDQRPFAKKKFITDLSVTIGPALLIIIIFVVTHSLGKTRSNISNEISFYLVIHLHYLVAIPLIFNIFVLLFYTKNKNIIKTLLREWNNN